MTPNRAPSLRSWLVLSHVGVLALPLLVVIGTGALMHDLRDQTREDLRNQAALLALLVSAELDAAHASDPSADVHAIADELTAQLIDAKAATLSGVRVVDARGIVVATSGEELGDDFSDREEVREALAGATGDAERPRPPISEPQPLSNPSRHARVRLFVATPIVDHGALVGAVVLSRTPREEMQALYQMMPWWPAFGAIAATIALAWASGGLFAAEVSRLGRVAARIGGGDLSALDELARPVRSPVREIADLAGAVSAMAVRLRDRLQYISEFASNVSHEFRTPITTLRGTIELLRDDPSMPGDQRARFLDNALSELDRLDRLVGGLLALARAEQPGERRLTDLATIARSVGERHPGVRVEGTPGKALGDPAQLDTAVENLVINALRHGGPAVHVTIALWSDDTQVGIDVIDDGPGISPANQAKIFDRFFTTGRKAGGTGLGLAMVRAIARAHGGEVTFTSAPGRTAFRVALPLAIGSAGPA